MNPIVAALWFIESHLADDLSLESIAAQVNVSPYYLTRAFTHLSGKSIMRYVRGRRLSMAAREPRRTARRMFCRWRWPPATALTRHSLARSAISSGCTPEAVRAQGHIDNLAIVEPIAMTHQHLPDFGAAAVSAKARRC